MRINAEQRKDGGRRAPVSALALLALLAHAFVITTLHAHPRALVLNLSFDLSSDSRTLVRDERPTESATSTGRHAQCLLCNFQRDFVTDPDTLSPVTAAPARPCARTTAREARAHAEESYLLPGGRAPPQTHNS